MVPERLHKMTRPRFIISCIFACMVGPVLVYCALKTWRQDKRIDEDTILNVASYISGSCEILDPANIQTSFDYFAIYNLYGRLVRYNSSGDLVPDIARSFEWRGAKLVFSFGDKVRTVDGAPITALDASASLKRAMVIGKNGHTNLHELLCAGRPLRSIQDSCAGIQIEDDRLVLIPIQPELGGRLLALLESADFSIIPTASFKRDSHDLSINDFRNSSGPYYVAKDDLHGRWVLKANPKHYDHSGTLPQTVQMIPVDSTQLDKYLRAGEVDLIPSNLAGTAKDLTLANENSNHYHIHETLPIKLVAAYFTERGLQNFSVSHRVFAARAALAAYQEIYSLFKPLATNQFFQPFSDGALNSAQLNEVQETRDATMRPSFSRPIQIGIPQVRFAKFKEVLSRYPEIQVVPVERHVFFREPKDRYDFFILQNDSAWSESLALLNHNFGAGAFHLPGLDSKKWMVEFALSPNREERLAKLNWLHFELLRKVVIFPSGVMPYYAVIRKPWSIQASTRSTTTGLWQVKRSPHGGSHAEL